jgi:hypothetical protein
MKTGAEWKEGSRKGRRKGRWEAKEGERKQWQSGNEAAGEGGKRVNETRDRVEMRAEGKEEERERELRR